MRFEVGISMGSPSFNTQKRIALTITELSPLKSLQVLSQAVFGPFLPAHLAPLNGTMSALTLRAAKTTAATTA
jgi:hypothetical protein